MSDTSAIDAASRRLALAMDALAAAVERRREAEQEQAALVDQLHALGTDRSKLAVDLDTAAARVRALETANRDIAKRLDGAMQSIRAVLEANDR